jgi:sarcosine oxidase subunit gamma
VSDVLSALPVTRYVPTGHYGTAGSGVTITRQNGLYIASIIVARHRLDAVREACGDEFEVALPLDAAVVEARDTVFIATGPCRWLAISHNSVSLERVRRIIMPYGSVCDQSDAYIVFDIGGARIDDALAKGVNIDLDPASFRIGMAANTAVTLISLTFWRVRQDLYRFAVPRSFAAGFMRFLVASAAEFGCTVQG